MKKIHSRVYSSLYYTVLLLIMVGLCGCSGGGTADNNSGSPVPAKKVLTAITIQPAGNKLALGKTQQFSVVGTYTDGTTSTDLSSVVVWSSTSSPVARIDSNGIATAISVGTTTITANLDGVTATTTLTVPAAPVVSLLSISIFPLAPVIAVGTTQQFTVKGTYSDNSTQDLTAHVTWSSSAGSIAAIAQNGKATAVAGGSAIITAESGALSAVVALKVTTATLSSIAVTSANPAIAAGTSNQLTAIGAFSDNTTQDLTSQVTWNSSAGSVIAIDRNGTATAVAAGAATVTATLGTTSVTTTLNATSASLRSITITPDNSAIAAGMTQQFKATGTFSDNTIQELTNQVAWSSSVASVATIGPDGKAFAVAAGTSVINAQFGGVSGSQNLTVTPADVSGIWEGTYTIYDGVDPREFGTYRFRLVLSQSGSSVTGTSSLRYNIDQQNVEGQLVEAHVTGRQVNFTFSYVDKYLRKMVNVGTATITETSLSGDVLENYNGGYNCSYTCNLKKADK